MYFRLVLFMKAEKPARIMTEVETVSRARRGDEDAYRELFERYFTKVYRVAISYVGTKDEAKDVLQTAFIAAFRSLGKLDDPEKFGPWIASIARRAALNHIKKRAGRAEAPLPIEGMDYIFFCSPPTEDKESGELELDVIRDVIGGIPNDSIRETVSMFYISGLATEEISGRQGIPKSTVTSRLDRFRIRYQKLIMLRILKLRGDK